MAFFGTGLKIAKGFARKEYLISAIEQNKKIKELPILDFYTGIQRLNHAIDLCDAITDNVFTGQGHSQLVLHSSLNSLQKEYKMNKEALESEAATKAQIYALGLAIKELSIGLEIEKKEFETILRKSSENFQNMINKAKEENQKILDNNKIEVQNISKENIKHIELKIKILSYTFSAILFLLLFLIIYLK